MRPPKYKYRLGEVVLVVGIAIVLLLAANFLPELLLEPASPKYSATQPVITKEIVIEEPPIVPGEGESQRY